MSKKPAKKKTLIADGLVAQNRKARHNFTVLDTIEAGIMLQGTEVKSLRLGRASIQESYASFEEGELYIKNLHIPEYEAGTMFTHDTRRARKLLLHKKELSKLHGHVAKKGMTLVPLKIYFNQRGIAKVLLGICEGKQVHDKRQDKKDKDWNRQKARLMREKG